MWLALTTAILLLSTALYSQRLALVEPESAKVEDLGSAVRAILTPDFRIIDESLADAAFRSVTVADPFNLTTSDARRIGEVIGVNNFILLRSAVQRRASLDRPAYFEAYAIAYVVNTRTGALEGWFRESVEGANEKEARVRLIANAGSLADRIAGSLKQNRFSIIRDTRFE